MEELQMYDKASADQERFFKQLFDGAQGSIIDLSAVPTGNALQPGQIGSFGSDIYIYTPTGRKIKLSGSSWS